MKIQQISKLVTLSLVLVLMSFGVAVSWSLNHLNQAFKMVEFFGQQKDRIYNDINQPVYAYLYSGDTLLLSNLERNLDRLKDSLQANDALSDTVKNALAQMLNEIRQTALPKLAAAGKLANPQLLLLNNEKQVSAHLQTLLDYVERAGSAPADRRHAYLLLVGQAQSALQGLSGMRQRYFSESGPGKPDSMQNYLRQLNASATALQQLPLLGVMQTQTNDEAMFTLGDSGPRAEAEDMALEPLAEIHSLLQRYQKDLDIAGNIVANKIDTQADINRQMQVFNQKLQTLQSEINGEYQYYETLLYGIMAACMLLIVLASGLMLAIKQHLALIISHVTDYVDKLANGDLSASIALASKVSEIKQLETSLKKLHDYFKLLIGNIDGEISTLANFGGNIEQVARNLNNIIADQRQATEMAARQMNELSLSFKAVAANAAESQTSTTAAQNLIEQGVDHIGHTNRQVADLARVIDNTAEALLQLQRDAKAIESVLGMIQGFAEQTNLLALNAAIEAARAGEHGRGFAVVADEVRNLAGNTAQSANQIQALVEKLGKATHSTVELMTDQQKAADQTTQAMQQVDAIFNGIKQSMELTYRKSARIAEATVEQLQMTEQLAHNFENTAELSRQTTAAAQTNIVSASSLAGVCDNLRQLIVKFKLA
ncbi:methyl-accepting chemotaxis protein [Methylomonas rivi]|uniref:Methyl-accepting chemotaxis protein n=1 Tax=Methylomonas rivi TaxID=2952226 RepID=A0ABT1U5C5_9GAMM|nr:methyl-accepting chemotaxis protein [Methylomonas sp. WSC-6]MCQ8129054.1 methyl-accepting chemotaxis protein [Methylomonas sp. WSC-6]